MIRVACFVVAVFLAVALALAASPVVAADLPPIQTVAIRDRALQVNGEPFLPIMIWLQDAKNFPAARACRMNTVAGYWPESSGTKDVTEYLTLVREAGLYGVMPFHEGLKGRPALLGYIHGDEPDLPHQVSDAEVVPADHLRINRKTPLWKLVDGVTHSWSVLDPMNGAEVTIRPKQPVTAVRLALHLTVSKGLAVAKEVVFEADGKPVLEASLEKKKGRQAFDLPGPVTFKALTLNVTAAYPGEHVWGSLGEVEAFNREGENVLLAPPRQEPRTEPDVVQKEYEAIKAHDPSRPVFMTVTGNFHPHFEKYADARRKRLYPAYIRAADVVGYDIYPIYGWNKPEWIHLVHDATARLTAMAGHRPVYAWIETSRGGQWTGDLARQKKVTPRHIRAEVWMAVTGGATAIGYFTHIWKPSYKQFGVPEENRTALAEINSQLARLAPAILGKRIEGTATAAEDGVKVDAVFREAHGARYVFAVNYDERQKGTDVTFAVPGLADAAAVEVIDENRTLRAAGGRFTDRFDPLAVHLYRVPAGGAAPSTDRPDAAPGAEAEAADGFVPLFPKDGVPEGWRVTRWSDVSKPPPEGARWTVRDGVLHGSAARGTWLVSRKTYGDFILACEFRLPRRGNSGIGLRFPDAGDPAYDGLELQVVDPAYYGGQGEPDQLTGALYKASAPAKQVYRPGEWNRYRITLRGPRVHVVLNGEVIQDLDLDRRTDPLERGSPLAERPRRGHIGFQELGRGNGQVEYRRVRLKVLDE